LFGLELHAACISRSNKGLFDPQLHISGSNGLRFPDFDPS